MSKRELKFRAWDDTKLNWIDVRECSYTDLFKDDKYVVQQYTGLKDNNGKEIYEGDLVKFGYTEYNDFFGQVTWFEDRASFGIVSENAFETMEDLLDCMHLLEVVGNIYELPCKPDHNGECLLCDECVGGCPFLTLSE